MKRFREIAAAGFAMALTGLVSQHADAAPVCTDVTVLELGAGFNSAPPEFDMPLYVKRVDNGTQFWAYVRHSSFNHTGVQRLERLATAAFLAGKKLYLCWDSSSSNVTQLHLK